MLGVIVVGISRATLIEGHDDIRTDRAFDIHHLLRREHMLGTVEMRAELGSLFMQLAIVGKGEYLKPPTIGQYRSIPRIKLMQASGLLQDLDTGTKIQMVRIPQDDLCLGIFL